MPLRVVYLIDNLGSGGAQRQAVELAVAMRAQADVDVRVLVYQRVDASRDRSLFHGRLEDAGVPVVTVEKRGRLDVTLPLRIGRELRRGRADVVHAFMPVPSMWGFASVSSIPRRERPVFIGSERSVRASSDPVRRLLQGIVFRRSDAVTVNSRPAIEELAGELRVRRERLHYMPNGIDLEAWDRAAARPCPFELEPGRVHAALIGRFGREKNHVLLLDALLQLGPDALREWRVWFLGARTGHAGVAEALEGEIRRRGLEEVVRIAPPTPEVAALMRRLDLLVLPSKYEGFPNVVLEAMASGVPVVAAPVGDVPSLVVEGETGFLFAPEDAADLARALARARSLSPEARAALLGRARRLVETRHRIATLAAAHLALYRALARPDAGAAQALP